MYQNTDHAREAYGRAVHTYTEAAEELTDRAAELISHLVRDHWADAFVLVIEADTTDDGIPTFWARAVLDVNRLTISDESNADTGDYFHGRAVRTVGVPRRGMDVHGRKRSGAGRHRPYRWVADLRRAGRRQIAGTARISTGRAVHGVNRHRHSKGPGDESTGAQGSHTGMRKQ